jgi:pimeloyl-ACP methyl ester carboxylesterase
MLLLALAMGAFMGLSPVFLQWERQATNPGATKHPPSFFIPFMVMSFGMLYLAWSILRSGRPRLASLLQFEHDQHTARFRFAAQSPMHMAWGFVFFSGVCSHAWILLCYAVHKSTPMWIVVLVCAVASALVGLIAYFVTRKYWRAGRWDYVIDCGAGIMRFPANKEREKRRYPREVPLAQIEAIIVRGSRIVVWAPKSPRCGRYFSSPGGFQEDAFDAGQWIAEQLDVPLLELSKAEIRRMRTAAFPGMRKAIPILLYFLLLCFSIAHQRRQEPTPTPLPNRMSSLSVPAFTSDGGAVGPDISLAYREWHADGSGVPVILLHGSPGSAQDFDSLAPLIDTTRRVIAPDMLGYGGTTGHIDDRSIKAYARMMLAMMDRLTIEKVHIVGWSNGGGVALHMADLAPGRVVSVTMLASIGLQEHEPSGSYEFEHFKYKAAKVIFGGLPELLPHFGVLGTYDSRTAWADFFDDSDQRELKGVMERIGTGGMPTLILHGRHDFLVPWFAAEDHFEKIESSRLVMLEASHFIPFQQAEEASEVLNGWFARIEPFVLGPFGKRETWAPTPNEIARAASMRRAFLPTGHQWREFDDRSAQRRVSWIEKDLNDCTTFVRETPWWAALLVFGVLFLRCRVATIVLGCVLVLHCWLDPFLLLTGVIASGLIRVLVLAVRTRRKARAGVDRPPHVLISLLAAIFWPVGAMIVAIAVDRFALAPLRQFLGDGAMGVVGVLITPVTMALSIVVVMGLCSRAGRHQLRVSFERLINHEYWPTQAFYFPFYPRFLWMAFRNGGVRQVTCCNPEIEHGGGWAGESKIAIMQKLAPAGSVVLPTYLVPRAATARERVEVLRGLMAQHREIGEFPVVLKPNEAQRGHAFKLARSMEQAEQYLSEMTAAAVVQPYHAGPEECGIFWMRYSKKQVAAGRGPDGRPIAEGRLGFIYSITRKEFPRVVGDGTRTLERLVREHPRYRRQATVFLARFTNDASRVPAKGEEVRLAISGNHCQGTLFRDGADLITPALEAEVDRIAGVFPRLDYGRFDIRFTSEDELRQGRGMAIIELNGSSSEPTNMYDPDRSYFWALGVLAGMWRQVLELAKERRAEGVKPLTVRQFVHVIRENAKGLKGSSIAD